MAPSPFITNLNGSQTNINGRSDFPQHLQRHHPYYINGGDIHFLVENYVFRVHRYFFERESTYFRDKLSFPPTPGRAQQGTEDANAIVLDVRAQDFEKLMWVFYNPKYSIYEADVPTWAVILQLAHRWAFPEVKALSVRELEQKEMTPIDRIVLYQKYEVDENLLVTRFAAVCAREEPISVLEGEMLGIKTAMRLTQARERLRSSDGSKSPLPPHRNDKDVRDIVLSLFELAPPDSLLSPTTATATTAAAALPQPPSQSGQETSGTAASAATVPAPTIPTAGATINTAPATADVTATPADPAPTATEQQNVKGPTHKTSMGFKANTKPDQKGTPVDVKSTTETPAKTNETQDSSQTAVKDLPGSKNASTTDLTGTSPAPGHNPKSPSVGNTLSGFGGLFSSRKEPDTTEAAENTGTDADAETGVTGNATRGKKGRKSKGLF